MPVTTEEACFVHVPKTGGMTVIRMLEEATEWRRVQELPNLDTYESLIVPFKMSVLGHNTRAPEYMTLARLRSRTSSCTAFAVVRNPYDRLVSAFFYLVAGGQHRWDRADADHYLRLYGSDFDRFVHGSLAAPRPDVHQQMHFRPQTDWLCDESGTLLVDELFRFESFSSEMERLGDYLGVAFGPLRHENAAAHEHYLRYYSPATRAVVARAYEQDFVRLGYPVEPAS